MGPPPTALAVSICPQAIVLIAEDDGLLDVYSTYFESRGVAVSGTTTADEGLRAVAELRPDLVIIDITFRTGMRGVDVVHRLKGGAGTQLIPLVVLTDRPIAELPAGTRRDVEVFVRKPVTAERLLWHVGRLLESARTPERHESRPRSTATRAVAGVCPRCAHGLEWIERGRIGGREYDYYRWCVRGCGLFCFDREQRQWIALAAP
jgi:DNA-binding NtrC family response regulator